MLADAEDRLMVDLFRGYNSLVQPVPNVTAIPLIVKIAMQLVLLINIDEKDQIMQSNVWLTLSWTDFHMSWNPKDYNGLKEIRVAPDKIWLPDIVLFNNADGNYEVSFMCNALVKHSGEILWVPPAIYKSSCIIDVEFFPFDEQICHLIFGSWTYNREEIKLDFEHSDRVDVSEYSPSSIWDLVDAPAILIEDRSRIDFQVIIRRKTLFYSVVLLLPTIVLAFLNLTVFYLPTASGEKMGLTMNVLLSIVVFLLLVSKILPPTSSSIPLVAKYLLLTFVLNIITILITVVIINIYFRGPITHRQPPWVRRIFLDFLPMIMCMERPRRDMRGLQKMSYRSTQIALLPSRLLINNGHNPLCRTDGTDGPLINVNIARPLETGEELTVEALQAVEAIEFITESIKEDDLMKQYRDDWRYMSMVVDRIMLYAFLGITIGGTCGIILSAPTVFEPMDQTATLQKLIYMYKQGVGRD